MASQTVHATVAHWTKCSNEHKQVVKALRAVGFNIPNPFCFSVDVEGPIVVDPVPGRVFEWKAKLNDIEDQDGTYEWHIPEGWETTVEGNMLFLNSYSSAESQELAVTYTTTDGTISSDTIVVHFSDVEWEPTNNMPVETIKSHFSNEIKEENILTLYPNPASQRVQLSFSQFEGNAIVEIYDINGRLVKTLNTDQPKVDIDISKFAAGIYLIKAITNERTFTQNLSVLH